MKKEDILKTKTMLPRKKTIDYLLSFSKSLGVLKTKTGNIIFGKN